MKKVLLLIILFASSVLATTTYRSGSYFNVGKQDTLEGDLFFGGRFLNVDGQVNGDIIVGAQSLILKGKVTDDVFAWCETIQIDGHVGDGIVAFGREIIINGIVQGDVRVYAATVLIGDNAEIYGNVYVGSGKLIVEQAVIHGKIAGGSGDVQLNGTIQSGVDLSVGKIQFGESFKSGDRVLLEMHEQPPESIPNAPANLEITLKPEEQFYEKFTFYWLYLSALIIGFLIIALFRHFQADMISLGKKQVLTNALFGGVFVVLMPIIALVAVVALPLFFILFAFYFILLYLSKIFVSYIVGTLFIEKVGRDQAVNPYLAFFIGLTLITLLTKIPIVGSIIMLLIVVWGSGTFIRYWWHIRKNNMQTIG